MEKGPTTEPRTRDLRSNAEFQLRELQNQPRSLVTHRRLCVSHGCAESTSSEMLLRLFYMLVLTGPTKVEGVMFGNNVVKNGSIHQEIKWNMPVLMHNDFPEYIIRYADSERELLSKNFEFSSDPNTTLQLNFTTTNITYYVVVAVRPTGMQRRGDYSNPAVSITYTSEFIMRTA